jgi:hypothetical protein
VAGVASAVRKRRSRGRSTRGKVHQHGPQHAHFAGACSRWSHIDHVLANCLKRLLRLEDDEAQVVVFQLTADQRFDRILELDKLKPLRKKKAARALEELCLLMGGLRQVRNNVAHAVLMHDGTAYQIFASRKTLRTFTKAQILETEELTNYTAHAALVLRDELGDKDPAGAPGPLPARPKYPLGLINCRNINVGPVGMMKATGRMNKEFDAAGGTAEEREVPLQAGALVAERAGSPPALV